MKFEIGIADRVVLIQLLQDFPKTGSYLYYKEFAKVAADVSIGEAEQRAIDWQQNDEKGTVAWDPTKVKIKTVNIPECILKPIKAALLNLDKSEQLKPEHIPVYEKFVPEEERPKPEEPKPEGADA